ncbi:hypothetical protein BGZ52_003155 [Haplosporangium bisporale]|nr:hypothetical protein BGZ52_003155 [Haplosporangium bisporale]
MDVEISATSTPTTGLTQAMQGTALSNGGTEAGNTPAGTNGDTPADAVKTEDQTEVKKEALKNLYEQSTQYNHWRFTQSGLSERRSKMNQEAIAAIQTNIEEERSLRSQQGLLVDDLPTDLNFLTVDEELALLGFYERKIVQIFRFWKLPSYATATAIAFMKRFFLENTAMDYHPKDVMLTCMFLARKTENFLMSIEDFFAVLKSSANSAESILNLEFLAVTDNIEKLQKVNDVALKLIDTSLYTDLCFLYQPSQIALAAMRIACKEESYDFERYAAYKFKSTEAAAKMYEEVLLPILVSIDQILKQDPRCTEVEKAVASDIDRRLKLCKDPAKDPESLLFKLRKRTEQEEDDDDDDDDDDKNDDRNQDNGRSKRQKV